MGRCDVGGSMININTVFPDYGDMTTLPKPSDNTIRSVIRNARDLAPTDDRITTSLHSLVGPAWVFLHELLFDPTPNEAIVVNESVIIDLSRIIDGPKQFDVCIRLKLKADCKSHRVTDVRLTAEIL